LELKVISENKYPGNMRNVTCVMMEVLYV